MKKWMIFRKLFKLLKTLIFYWKELKKTIKNETKEQKGGVLGMLSGTLGASLLENILAGKVIVRAGYGNEKENGMLKAGYG